ncbi:Mucin-associated surface protein (MASP) [Trypanosoma cruzi]|uniref:Mucin-associated surface protein (MASP), putative n=2 Tax=Trypanosoma cruzi TaxID=5693 RepID=Q4DU19_TRYCC|nr:mucin-associated surface protein (MASP), putative [Trypanosoma cruzi]EAN96003.1 mucin-associated surface protein (MASP), putative [Trypanosoma cruzi]PWV19837.1 Mucin-associated surface protein (MASP) [Trypanosoma cruzi]|eukprot:XP_817854.1 mucin-associated surface protein (MASP) [Trypanosoma cruzi strain CL Brener]
MAMMMTGRVLLVCALCVLWCVTVFGIAMDNRCVEDDGNVLTHTHNGGNDRVRLKADFGLISTRMGLIKVVEAGEREGEDLESVDAPLDSVGGKSPSSLLAGSEDNEAPGAGGGQGAAGAGAASLPSGPGVPGTGDENRQSLMAGQKGNEKKNLDPDSKEPKESQDQTTDQLSSSSGSTSSLPREKPSSTGTSDINQLPTDTETKGDVDPRNNSGDDEERDEEETGREKEENKLQPETQERGNNAEVPQSLPAPPSGGPAPTKPSGGPASSLSESEGSPPTEPKNSQNPKKVTKENTPSESKMESKATQPPSGDATQGRHSHDTDTEDSTKNAAAGSPAEPTTSSSSTSGSGDHVQNKADKDDAQSSEEQHDSLETGNTNVVPTLSETAPQTPIKTPANTTYTVNAQNSDGSTAVSHTTSPLLLLLLLAACAAAAAVAA